ncbi:MAG: hypothetical protein ACQERJ_07390 [Bacillota bacterium]
MDQQRNELVIFLQALFIVIVVCSILMLSIPYGSLVKDVIVVSILFYLLNKYLDN